MAGLTLQPPSRPPEGLRLPATARTLVMGILNVTPDSFSDGGRYLDVAAAVAHGVAMAQQGADIVDVGGESTRPGAQRVPAGEEERRVLPVVEELSRQGVPVSIDTMRATTAQAAVASGAVLVNDVSGGLADPGMLDAVAELAVPCILMHWRGHSDTMGSAAHYHDVVSEVGRHLLERAAAAVAAGVPVERVVVDPGLGFAKDAGHNWELLRRLDEVVPPGMPFLVGASRKRFLGSLLPGAAGAPRPVAERDAATAAVTTLAAAAGAWCVRVHDVASSADAVRVVAAWREAAADPAAVGAEAEMREAPR